MPKIAFYKNLVFFLYSADVYERWHLHVVNNKSFVKPGKIWLDTAEVFDKGSLTDAEIALAAKLIDKNRQKLLAIIRNFTEGEKIKPVELKLK